MPAFTPNPKAFTEASKPHESVDAANDAIRQLNDDLEVVRQKHHLSNMVVVFETQALDSDKQTILPLISDITKGDAMRHEALAAYGLASTRRTRQSLVLRLIAGAAQPKDDDE